MVNFSTEDADSNQLEIVNEVTEKEGAEGDAVEIGVRFQWKCVHPTKEQSQESDDNQHSTGEMSEEDEQDAAILPNRLGDVVEDRRKAERFENCFHLSIFLADQTDQQDQKPERMVSLPLSHSPSSTTLTEWERRSRPWSVP